METLRKTKKKSEKQVSESNEVKKLSKIGEWLESGQSALTIVDMRAVLR